MAAFPPYHLRQQTHPTEFSIATNNARCSRWFPVLILLAHKEFSDYEIGRLLGLREEYEGGVTRKG